MLEGFAAVGAAPYVEAHRCGVIGTGARTSIFRCEKRVLIAMVFTHMLTRGHMLGHAHAHTHAQRDRP